MAGGFTSLVACCPQPHLLRGPHRFERIRRHLRGVQLHWLPSRGVVRPGQRPTDLKANVAKNIRYLEDHPMTCKWLITMVSFRPLSRVVPLPNGLNGL